MNKKYTFIITREINQLIIDVNRLIESGWKSEGGVCIVAGPSGTNFIQAMAK